MDPAVPTCPGCLERDRLTAELTAKFEKRIAELERRLAEVERAGKRQAAPFAKAAPKADPKKPGRKAGEHHGPHSHRPPPAPELVQQTLEAPLPEACPHCGGAIAEDADVDEQFQTDIPTAPVRRRFRIHKGSCRRCGRRVHGHHPLQTSGATGAAASQIGPNAQAAIVYLNKRSGLSYGKIADYFKEANGLDLHPSTATRIVLRAADKLQPTYQEIRESIKNSKAVCPDETGWRNGGRPVWLHVAVGDQATCYFIDRRRSADALQEIIGPDYSGALIHDGFASYDRFVEAIHQQCVAHALRRAHGLQETQVGRAKEFPRRVIELFQSALAVRDAGRAGRLSPEDLEEAYVKHLVALWDLSERPRANAANAANATFARHLYNHAEHWFPFLLEPGLPATNFQAEQALRTPIVNRKVFGGNRTDAGCRAQVITGSTIQTCKQQGRSAFAFLRDAVCNVVQRIIKAVADPSNPVPCQPALTHLG